MKYNTVDDIISSYNSDSMSIHDITNKVISSNEYKYPETLVIPKLSHNHTSVDAKKYAEDLELYENEKKSYHEKLNLHRNESYRLESLIEEFIKEESGLNTIPEYYREKVYSYAYEQSRSNGYSELFNTLRDLIYIFE